MQPVEQTLESLPIHHEKGSQKSVLNHMQRGPVVVVDMPLLSLVCLVSALCVPYIMPGVRYSVLR
jgi:hypothetical protein